jgi:hypothetical protein
MPDPRSLQRTRPSLEVAPAILLRIAGGLKDFEGGSIGAIQPEPATSSRCVLVRPVLLRVQPGTWVAEWLRKGRLEEACAEGTPGNRVVAHTGFEPVLPP